MKSIVSIVMGLALTHTILTVLSTGDNSSQIVGRGGSTGNQTILPLSQVPVTSALCAIAIITAIIRFYHGNNQLLESLYGESSTPEKTAMANGIGINFIVIMLQSVFFALMSFYVTGERQLILLFGLLLILDIFWYVANRTTADTDPKALRQQRNWMFNNLFFLLILTILYYTNHDGWPVAAGAGAIILNTVIDFRISWEFYFPPPRSEPSAFGASS